MIIEDTKELQFVDPVPNFPAEFKELPCWGVYGKGKKFVANGDRDKVPCDPRTGQPANTSEGRTDFTTAVSVLANYHGLGFGPLPYNAGYSFLDFDDCVDPTTRTIEPRVAQVIKEVGGYWEFSPSGTGVHGFSKWQAADQKGHKVGKAEIYPCNRYFTVSGNQIPGTGNSIEWRDLTQVYVRIVSGEFASPADKDKVTSTKAPLNLKARVGRGFHDTTITRYAGTLRDKGLNAEEMLPVVTRYVEEQFDGLGSDYHQMIAKCVKSICKHPAGDPTPTVLQMPKETAVDIIPAGKVFKNPVKTKKSLAQYPLWVWEGTLLEQFSDICSVGNHIPREFFLEALKAIIGAVAGHRIQPEQARGQQPSRWYSILIGPGGCGKSTAVKWGLEVFIGTGLIYALSQTGAYTNIGCARESFGSDVGMKKGFAAHNRILQVYDEASELIEKFSIKGSGGNYLDALNELFEYCPMYPSLNTKEDKITGVSGRESHNSILGCSTPLRWRNCFMKSGTESSGFQQRLNVVSNFKKERVAELALPDLSAFREALVRKLQPLEYQNVLVRKTPEAAKIFDDWLAQKESSEYWQNLPDDIKGRINVLIQRNYAQLAFFMSGDDITPSPESANIPIIVECDEDIMRRAIALGETEIGTRLLHQPPQGDNEYAIMENSIMMFFAENGGEPVFRNTLFKKLHAARVGTIIFDKCITALCLEGYIRLSKNENDGRRGRKAQIVSWVGDEMPEDN